MIWLNFIKKYLGCFAAKDIESLEDFYDDSILVEDWNGRAYGKKEFLEANKSFFRVYGISIHIKNSCYKDKYICVEYDLIVKIKIHNLHEPPTIVPIKYYVVSIFEINNFGKIEKMRSYKR